MTNLIIFLKKKIEKRRKLNGLFFFIEFSSKFKLCINFEQIKLSEVCVCVTHFKYNRQKFKFNNATFRNQKLKK